MHGTVPLSHDDWRFKTVTNHISSTIFAIFRKIDGFVRIRSTVSVNANVRANGTMLSIPAV